MCKLRPKELEYHSEVAWWQENTISVNMYLPKPMFYKNVWETNI